MSDGNELTLSVVSGDSQIGMAFEELPTPLVVQIRDSRNRPVSGQLLNFRIVEGGGSVYAGAAQTDRNGMAREYWTLGGPGGQLLEARAVGPNGEKLVFGTFYAFAEAPFDSSPAYLQCFDEYTMYWRVGAPCTLDGGWAPADSAFPVTFRVVNADTVPLAGILLRFALDTLGSEGMVFPDSAFSDTLGQATVTWQLGSLPDTNRLTGFVEGQPWISAEFQVLVVDAGVEPDTLPPVLMAFDITPDTLVVDTAPGVVTFDLRLTDDAGVTNALVRSEAPDSTLAYCFATLVSGTPQDGIWTCSLVLPDTVQYVGTWAVQVQTHSIGPDSVPGVPSSLFRVWDGGELAALGFPVYFVVLTGGGGAPATGAPGPSSSAAAPPRRSRSMRDE